MMSDSLSNASPAGIEVDSLSANEFAVELDGERIGGIFRVTGLTPFKLEVKPALTKQVHEPFRVSKMVQRSPNAPFNRWIRETIAAKDDIVRPLRTLVVLALDDGLESRRWVISGAWISEISYSEFDSGSSDLVEEKLTIHYESIDEQWNTA